MQVAVWPGGHTRVATKGDKLTCLDWLPWEYEDRRIVGKQDVPPVARIDAHSFPETAIVREVYHNAIARGD